jgi:predicted MFS family arabinose efflux permease
MVVSLNSSAIYVGIALGTTLGSATIDISTTANLVAALFMSVLVWLCVKFLRP